MAKPAFIYAFDNLGPYRFTELCGELLGSRYRGFLLGGEGSDGGIDAEIDQRFGVWQPEYKDAFFTDTVQPGETIVFQFKHKVTARVGQAQSRAQLLNLYECKGRRKCELHSDLIQEKKITSYFLVTNVEVNSQFRTSFINQCKAENPAIRHYQVIGLDELVSWVEMMPELRHLYFPTIFGAPRFDLRITLSSVILDKFLNKDLETLVGVNILNVGMAPSYLNVNSVVFVFNIDGNIEPFRMIYRDLSLTSMTIQAMNPKPETPLEPGRKHTYHYCLSHFSFVREKGDAILPIEIQVHDEIGNVYRQILDEEQRKTILTYIYNESDGQS